ncbi:hypothetical protein MCAP1_003199 [Malassezia caprae]|uniref:Uncharacterized protein n=1 Tax=Malassezia caprae TaxID=1381934 RepID=A0AAF0E9R7_9BASI|nr:hypothetical protein MCAP1_003199 [Malassezia caprae]
MFFRVVVPPALHLLAVLLIIFALVSPVPFHGSSLSLLYMMPVLAPEPPASSSSALVSMPTSAPTQAHAMSSSSAPVPSSSASLPMAYSASSDHIAPASMPPTLQRRNASYAPTQPLTTTSVRYTIGLLGSCYVDAHHTFHCTASSLRPTYNTTWLTSEPGMDTDTSSLPTGLTTQPALVLVALLAVLGTSAVHVRRVMRQCIVPVGAPPTERGTVLLVRMATHVQDGAAAVLLLIMIVMRVQTSHAISAFRAANAGRVLGPELLAPGPPGSQPVPLMWDLDAGTTFSAVCVAACLLLATSWLERRRLRAERADTMRPRGDVSKQASWSKRAWAALVHTPLSTPMHESKPHISAPLPLHPVVPPKAFDSSAKVDSVPPTPMQEPSLWRPAPTPPTP